MYWYHISLSPVKEFVPRIPKMTYESENKTIPRICVSSNLQKAFRAAPQMGNILRAFLDNGIHPVIYIYRFYKKDFQNAYMTPSEVWEYVADAIANEEYWLLKAPTRVSCKKVVVSDALLRFMEDMFSVKEYFCYHVHLKTTRSKKTNEEILMEHFQGKKYEEYANVILEANLSTRTKICFMIKENLLKYKEDYKNDSQEVREKNKSEDVKERSA